MAGIDKNEAPPPPPPPTDSWDFNFLIVNPENGGVLDLFRFLVFHDQESGAKFLRGGGGEVYLLGDGGGDGTAADHRWVIVVSVLVRKILKALGKPMGWLGYLVEFILNLLSLNGNFLGLLLNFLQGMYVSSSLFVHINCLIISPS